MWKAGWGTTHLRKYQETWNLFVNFCPTILVIYQLDAKNFIYNKFILNVYMFGALCAHHEEIKFVLYSIWCHQNYRWPSGADVEMGLCTGRLSTGVMLPDAVFMQGDKFCDYFCWVIWFMWYFYFLIRFYTLVEGLYVKSLRILCNLHYLQVITFMAPCLYTWRHSEGLWGAWVRHLCN